MGLLSDFGKAVGGFFKRVGQTLFGSPEIKMPKPPPMPEQALFSRATGVFARNRRRGVSGTLLTSPLGIVGPGSSNVSKTLLGQ
jgi:hypothetical protein